MEQERDREEREIERERKKLIRRSFVILAGRDRFRKAMWLLLKGAVWLMAAFVALVLIWYVAVVTNLIPHGQ
jgi:hypothetical protein